MKKGITITVELAEYAVRYNPCECTGEDRFPKDQRR
jgi:hypothetical protein